MYQLKITKKVKNPQYDELVKKHTESFRYGSPPDEYPNFYIEERALEVELTEEEWGELKPKIVASFEVKKDNTGYTYFCPQCTNEVKDCKCEFRNK